MQHRNLTISLHRKQIFNVFYFEKRTQNKKTLKRKKRDKNKNVKNVFYIYAAGGIRETASCPVTSDAGDHDENDNDDDDDDDVMMTQ